jgi:hypothetical protein
MNDNCKAGNHTLEVIQRVHVGYEEYQVVRWCSCCGSVVVDGEYDDKIYPGKIMKMKSPK